MAKATSTRDRLYTLKEDIAMSVHGLLSLALGSSSATLKGVNDQHTQANEQLNQLNKLVEQAVRAKQAKKKCVLTKKPRTKKPNSRKQYADWEPLESDASDADW